MALLAVLTAFFMGIGYMFGGSGGMLTAFIFALLLNFGTYWYSDKIVLKMYRAKPLKDEPELKEAVEKLAKKAGIPVPKLYFIDSRNPNAFATGRNPDNSAIVVSKGLLGALDDDEIEGVLAHEMSHIKNRDTLVSTIAATMAGAITFMSRFALFFGGGRNRQGGNLFSFLFMLILAPIAALLIRMAISRNREYLADKTGAVISGKPLKLAGALEKIEHYSKQVPMRTGSEATSHLFIINPFNTSLSGLFSTHPSTEERVRRLKSMA